MGASERDLPTLSGIDQYVRSPGSKPFMDSFVQTLDDDQLDALRAACGLTYDGEHQRPWTAIASWLNKDCGGGGKVSDSKIRKWAADQR